MMTYNQLMQQLQAYRQQYGETFRPTLMGGSGEGAYDYQGAPQPVLEFPVGDPANRTFARYDPQSDSFTLAQGDGQTGGIQRYAVTPQGSQDLGFEAIDRPGFGERLLSAAALPTAVAGLGALAPMLGLAPGAAGAAGTAAGAAAAPAASAATGGLGGATFGAGSLPTSIGMGGVGAGMIGLPSIADGTLSANDIMSGGGYLGGGDSAPTMFAGGNPNFNFGRTPNAPSVPGGGTDWMSLLSNPALLSMGAGALAGIAGNDDITQSQSSSASGSQGLAPWLQPFAQDFVGRAQQLANAPTSNATMDAGRGVLTSLATQGDPLVNAARSQQQNVIGGGLLNANPHIDQVAQNIGNRMGDAYAVGTRANTATRFNNDGNSVGAKSAYGQTNFMNDRAFGDALGSTMSNLYFGNYQQERAAQDAASRGSLGFGTFASGNAQNAYNVGAQDWMRPFMQNQQFGQAINPAFGSQTSTSGTQNQTITAPNNWMAGLGGAAMGAGIWNMFNPQRRA